MQILLSENVKTSLLENAGITHEMVVFTIDNVKFTFVEIISLPYSTSEIAK